MMLTDVAMVVFTCTAMNHLGLVDAIERTIGHRIPIVDCCKCSSFWATLAYCLCGHLSAGIAAIIATSFLAAIAAVWLELAMGYVDTLYDKAYEWIYDKATRTKGDGGEACAKAGDTDGSEAKVS